MAGGWLKKREGNRELGFALGAWTKFMMEESLGIIQERLWLLIVWGSLGGLSESSVAFHREPLETAIYFW